MRGVKRPIGKPQLLKELNSNHVFDLLVQENRLSRARLAQITGLSRATISLLVDELISAGLVSEAGQGDSRGGRPPIILEFNPAAAYALGAHLRSGAWRIVLTDLAGTPVDTEDAALEGSSPEDAVRILKSAVERLKKRNGGKRILPAIGLGCPGLVDMESGVIQSAADVGWYHVPMADMVRDALQLEAWAVNRSRSGALAEQWHLGSVQVPDLIYISVGSGIAAGIIHGGELLRGVNSSAGELGHTTIVPDGPQCPCGNRGCLQQLVSEEAIAMRAREALRHQGESSLAELAGQHLSRLSGFDVIEAADQGDHLAMKVIDECAEYLTIAIGNLINLFNPQRIIIGGPLGNSSRLLHTLIGEKISRRAMAYPLSVASISHSVLGDMAGSVGAAVLVLQRALRYLIPDPE